MHASGAGSFSQLFPAARPGNKGYKVSNITFRGFFPEPDHFG